MKTFQGFVSVSAKSIFSFFSLLIWAYEQNPKVGCSGLLSSLSPISKSESALAIPRLPQRCLIPKTTWKSKSIKGFTTRKNATVWCHKELDSVLTTPQWMLSGFQKLSIHEASAYYSLAVINLVSSGSLGLAFDIQVIQIPLKTVPTKEATKPHPSIHPHICLWYFACFLLLNYIFRDQFPDSTPFTGLTSPAINYHIREIYFPWHFYLWKKTCCSNHSNWCLRSVYLRESLFQTLWSTPFQARNEMWRHAKSTDCLGGLEG